MKKRIFAMFLTFVILVTAFPCAIMAEDVADENIGMITETELLYNMGVISEKNHTTASVSRGEFAKWLSVIAGLEYEGDGATFRFEDVSADSAYINAVTAICDMGIMKGISEKEFGLKMDITVTDAAVALVRLLGYEVAALRDGGYPGGYLKRAGILGLNKNIGKANGNARLEILMMCYNALTVPYLDIYGEVVEGSSFLEDVHSIYEAAGIVTANRFTSINSAESGIPVNMIEINNECYLTEDISAAEFIGENVKFFYREIKGENNKELVAIVSQASKNKKLVIKSDEIETAEKNILTYDPENGSVKSVKLQPGFVYIENNRTVDDRTSADLLIDDGEIELIDNNSDGIYEIVKAKRIETMVFEGIDDTEDILYCREGNIYIDPFDEKYFAKAVIVDEADNSKREVTLDEIAIGSVLTVYRSRDGRYLEIYACSSELYGKLEAIGEDEITVDGKVYKLPLKTPVDKLNLGAEITFSMDMFGRPVYLEDEKNQREPRYGYLFAIEAAKGLKKGKIQVIDGETNHIYEFDEKITLDDEVEYKDSTINTCACLYNGDGTIKRQLIRYRLNKNNVVTDIYTASGNSEYSIKKTKDINKDAETVYYQWHRIYAGKYILPKDSFFQVIPTAEGEADDEELYGTRFTLGDDVHNCYVEVYDVNEDMEAGAILMYSQDPLKGKVTTSGSTDVGIITKVAMSSDNHIAHIWKNGEVKVYEVDAENNPDINEYRFGDVVRFVVGKTGVVSTLDKVLDVGDSGETTPEPTRYQDGYDYHFFARVNKKLDSHYVLLPNYNNPTFDDAVENRIVAPASFGQCAVIDMKQKKVITGSYNSMAKYFETEGYGACYAYVRLYKWNTAKELFIYKF